MDRGHDRAPADRAVCVFAPAPILTITIERTGDDPVIHTHAGGQGVWVAQLVRRLEVPVRLCGLFGGETGRVVRSLLEDEGLAIDAVTTDAPNGSYVHERRDRDRTVIAESPTHEAGRHALDDLFGVTLVRGIAAGVVVLTGVSPGRAVPDETYRELALDLRANGVVVIADLSRDTLLQALRGGVDVLKISDEELVRDGFARGPAPDDVIEAMHRLVTLGARDVIVSRGERPGLALVKDEVLEIRPVPLVAVDHHGAGDSMTAGIAAGTARGLELVEAMRLGVAAGALNVVRHGLGTGRRSSIEQLMPRIQVQPYRAGAK